MSKEFRQIEKAPLYEMDKDGNIQTINKKTPAIPYPIGSKNVILKLEDGRRVTFKLDDLFEDTFGEKRESVKEEEKSEEVVPNEEATENVESEDSVLVTEDDKFRDQENEEKSERAKDTAMMPSSGSGINTFVEPKPIKEKKVKVVKEKKQKKEKVVKEKKAKVKKLSLKEMKEKLRKIRIENEPRIYSESPISEKIMKLDCMKSVKIWKWNQNGLNNDDITILAELHHDFVVVKTLEKYTKNETLRTRADKWKVE